jgi:hypothetical protein
MDPGAQSAGVLITMGRVYEEVTAARKDISSLDSKVEQALKQGDDHEQRIRGLENQAAQSSDHEQRISSVEKRVWMATGVTALLAAGASAAATLLAGTGR